jgi:hypothetical protein
MCTGAVHVDVLMALEAAEIVDTGETDAAGIDTGPVSGWR